MKVLLKNLLKSFSGECDDLVFYVDPRSDRLIARRYVKPRYSESNKRLGEAARHISALAPSDGYKDDLRLYIKTHNCSQNPEKRMYNNYYALYNKLIYAQARALKIDVMELSREMIAQQNLPLNTVKGCVEAGFLQPVYGYERLIYPMVTED